ncbi:MAG: hypothetical protein EAZ43_09410 [Betaproteobacteria bacterium]|nr:MAG: hypothetical protein EAZ43_09410 [Betaproteobacteria bacterium]
MSHVINNIARRRITQLSALAALLATLSGTCAAQLLTEVGNMTRGKLGHPAILLDTGKVLATGPDGHAELFDPVTNTWAVTSPMDVGSQLHNAVKLGDGRVLVVGGEVSLGALDSFGQPAYGAITGRAATYSPQSGTWTTVASLATARSESAAVVLAGGDALVIGGRTSGVGASAQRLASTERFNAAQNTWTAGPTLPAERSSHAAVTLSNGDVLVLGGLDNTGVATNSCFKLATGANVWTSCQPMPAARSGLAVIPLADGRMLVHGGAQSAGFEPIYNPVSNTWEASMVPSSLNGQIGITVRTTGTSVNWSDAPISSYSVQGNGPPTLPAVRLQYLLTSQSTQVSPGLTLAGPTSTPLPNGKILISGGFTSYRTFASLGTFHFAIPSGKSYLLDTGRLASTTSLINTNGRLPWRPQSGDRYPVEAAAYSALAGLPAPSGTVLVSDGTASCTASASNGRCLLTTSVTGTKSYTVTYAGDADYLPSTSTYTHETGSLLRIERIGMGIVNSPVGGLFGVAACGQNFGPIPDQCNLRPNAGATFTITAGAASGHTFVGWQGDCTGASTSCQLTMPASGSLSVQAFFAPSTELPLTLDVDGDSIVSAATDGQLIRRFAARHHDGTLVNAAVGLSPQRSDAQAIEDRLRLMMPLLDVDQNGAVEAATDGVVIVRYQLGFRGDSLTANAIGVGARRSDALLIAQHLQALMP